MAVTPVLVDRRVRRWMPPMAVSDELINSSSNTPHTRLFVASPTLPTLHQSASRRGSTSPPPPAPAWCRLPFAVCRCGRRAPASLDASAAVSRCCAVAREGRYRQFELDRLGSSVCSDGPPSAAEFRRLSVDDVPGGELNGAAVLVDTSTWNATALRRGTVDEPVYLPLRHSHHQPAAPPNDHDTHYFRCSAVGDAALISDGRLHDDPDLLFAS